MSMGPESEPKRLSKNSAAPRPVNLAGDENPFQGLSLDSKLKQAQQKREHRPRGGAATGMHSGHKISKKPFDPSKPKQREDGPLPDDRPILKDSHPIMTRNQFMNAAATRLALSQAAPIGLTAFCGMAVWVSNPWLACGFAAVGAAALGWGIWHAVSGVARSTRAYGINEKYEEGIREKNKVKAVHDSVDLGFWDKLESQFVVPVDSIKNPQATALEMIRSLGSTSTTRHLLTTLAVVGGPALSVTSYFSEFQNWLAIGAGLGGVPLAFLLHRAANKIQSNFKAIAVGASEEAEKVEHMRGQ